MRCTGYAENSKGHPTPGRSYQWFVRVIVASRGGTKESVEKSEEQVRKVEETSDREALERTKEIVVIRTSEIGRRVANRVVQGSRPCKWWSLEAVEDGTGSVEGRSQDSKVQRRSVVDVYVKVSAGESIELSLEPAQNARVPVGKGYARQLTGGRRESHGDVLEPRLTKRR